MDKPSETFDRAIKNITRQRGSIYGPPGDTFREIAVMQSMVSGCEDAAIRHALNMICVKMVRLARTPDHLDSVIDIAGYARTIAMVLDEEQKT